MKISIITPSYNQGSFIEEAIQSVKNQDYANFEHIIVDNCSTDTTKDILDKYPHLTVIREPDQGQSDALNKGFKQATGDIVGWLNADDKYLLGCFNCVVNFLKANPTTDIAYGNYYWINEKGLLLKKRRELDFDLFMLKYLHTLYIPSTATFLRYKVFMDGNFLDTNLKYAMDYDLFLRLALKGYSFKHINRFLADFRWHKDSKSSNASDNQFMEREKSLLKYDKFLSNLPVSNQLMSRKTLMYIARGKRYFLKALKGYYFDQYSR
jgi:glycosyltransferase involved in cell wall biosynthesis